LPPCTFHSFPTRRSSDLQFRSGMLKDLADTLQPLGIRLDCQTFDPALSAVDQRKHVGSDRRREKLLARNAQIDGRSVCGDSEVPPGSATRKRTAARGQPCRAFHPDLLLQAHFADALTVLARSHNLTVQDDVHAMNGNKTFGLGMDFQSPSSRWKRDFASRRMTFGMKEQKRS